MQVESAGRRYCEIIKVFVCTITKGGLTLTTNFKREILIATYYKICTFFAILAVTAVRLFLKWSFSQFFGGVSFD